MAFPGLQVDDRPQVQLARTGMGVMHRRHIVLVQNLVEIADVLRLVVYVYSGIFDDGHRFFIAGNVGQKPQSGLCEGPDSLRVVAEEQRKVKAQPGGAELDFQLGG